MCVCVCACLQQGNKHLGGVEGGFPSFDFLERVSPHGAMWSFWSWLWDGGEDAAEASGGGGEAATRADGNGRK